ncbi:3-hydroxybutyrate dehydrogenase [Melghirimyces algeriensis]|uniref:3-hydroxybutyrate dehydrogenase n=1 Tax=Melghirimyces algeriensis TaxID=910412 RepID=A0A521CNN5_9BACL|nr:3-hydroxybutyrate dehydrogenase [Melghirimyces algeriensis]SMO61059.1 3-hydroxybutyrate dehydrogenase [Melghirimyces algeriensis]
MKKRTVLVTGAAQGIGYSIAEAFAGEGAHTVIADLKEEEAIQAAQRIAKETGGDAAGYGVDVADEEQVKGLIDRISSDYGGMDILVNNAGLQYIAKVEDFPLEKWNQLIGVMLTGPFLLTKYTVPLMKKQRYGRIINISSVHGKTASPLKAAYISAKHGVMGLTKTVALETAEYGITVNAIMPGVVNTPLVQNQLEHLAAEEEISKEEALNKHLLHKQALKRFIKPNEIASCALYLASDGASSITGEGISVSGGW